MLTRRSSVGAAVLNCLNLEMGIAAAKNIWLWWICIYDNVKKTLHKSCITQI
jgi:hypothetical protein